MQKKLLVLLLIAALAIFVFAGCDGLFPSEGEGEGEGEGEIEGVVVEIEGAVEINGRTYVASGNHGITVTFPAPVVNAEVFVTGCTGDYGKQIIYYDYSGTNVVLFPNADKTVWTGSASFECYPCGGLGPCQHTSECCASYVKVSAGECEGDTCLQFPVIVDCAVPYACLEVKAKDCTCEGCEITFKSTKEEYDCAADELCCGDDCSGLASWAIAIYNKQPFDKCCETPCYEPIWTASGTECPISATTNCLTEDKLYYVIVTLADKVGHEVEYYATLELDENCGLVVTQYCANKNGCMCTDWDTSAIVDSGCDIGYCYSDTNCCY